MVKILAFAGCIRAESFTKNLVQIAAGAARQAGAGVTCIALHDYVLPDRVSVPIAQEAFDESGALKDARRQQSVIELGRKLADFSQKQATRRD